MTEENKLATLDNQYLKDKLSLGTEDVEMEDIPTPVLLLTQDISKVVDAQGQKIPSGKLYYSGTGEVFDELEVTLLILTKKDTPDFQTKQPTRTHIYLGQINNGLKPFLLYFKNTGLFASREFLGKQRAMRVPMFCLNVKLVPEQTSFEKNTWFKLRFQILGVKETMEEVAILEELINEYKPKVAHEIEAQENAQELNK